MLNFLRAEYVKNLKIIKPGTFWMELLTNVGSVYETTHGYCNVQCVSREHISITV